MTKQPFLLTEKIRNSCFSIGIKYLVIFLLICTATSLRCLSKILKLQASLGFGGIDFVPSHTTMRRWLNHYGYHKLISPKEKADDWIYIIDNSIRADCRKVCLILGVRSSKLKKGQYIVFEDVEIIEMRLIQKNKEVLDVIEEAIKKTNSPIQICSDEGPDIMPNVRAIQEKHPTIKHVPDMMHKVGNLLEKTLEKDDRWIKYVSNLNKSKNTLKQSQLSHLCPPSMRMQQRFFNCHSSVEWGDKMIQFLKDPELVLEEGVMEKLGWLLEQEGDLKFFLELFEIGQACKEIARILHIDKDGWIDAEKALKGFIKSDEGKIFADKMVDFLKIQCAKAEGVRMLGSSEIVESAFSKLKIIDRECGISGFTTSMYGLAACFGKTDYETVYQAFKEHSNKEVCEHTQKQVGETVTKKRRKILIPQKKKENKIKELALKMTRTLQEKKAVA